MRKSVHLFALINPQGIKKFRIMSDRNPTLLQQDTCWAHIFTTYGETFEEAHKRANDIIAKSYSWIKVD